VTAPVAPTAGTRIGRKYCLLRAIGVGGMGVVWIARNEATLAEVALKIWNAAPGTGLEPTDTREREATSERFRREAQLGALVTHRNIVQVFDMIEESDGTLALVMELLRGEPLDRYATRNGGRLTPLQAVAVMTPILHALGHIHRLGVVHRDLKPGNVFLTVDAEGNVVPKLVDFGVAKAPAAGSSLTLEGDALGTPRYMAPEQIRANSEIDGRADLFAAAVTLLELITGMSPFHATSAAASLVAVLERQVDPDPLVPPALWVELSRSLSKRAFERHATAMELADAIRNAIGATKEQLAHALSELAPSLEPVVPAQPPATMLVSESMSPPARIRKKRWLATVAGGTLFLAAVVVTVAVAQRGGRRAPVVSTAAPPPPSVTALASPPPAAPAEPPPPAASAAATATAAATPPAPQTAAARDPSPAVPRPRTPPRGPKPVATTPGF
jgi:eukaryotic-like serine/threonine-protein kinase